jgi:hypothetical protein
MVASLAVSSVEDVPVEVASVRVSLMHSAIVDVEPANLQGPRPDKEM